VFLASDAGDFTVGSEFIIDGGMSNLWPPRTRSDPSCCGQSPAAGARDFESGPGGRSLRHNRPLTP
jgi:hypothetical protein